MIRPDEVTLELLDKAFEDYAKYLEALLGKENIKMVLSTGKTSVQPTFWYRQVKALKKWRKDGRRISDIGANGFLLQFGSNAVRVKVFEGDWMDRARKAAFLRRLRSSTEAEGLVFELQVGIHFLRRGLCVEWTGADSNIKKTADLRIEDSDSDVLVECTCRQPRLGRVLWDRQMATDLINSADEKLNSKYDYGHPRLIAVRVPEEIDWTNRQLINGIEQQVEKWGKANRLMSTNGIVFMGQKDPEFVPWRRPGSVGYWSTSPQAFFVTVSDRFTRYPLSQRVIDASLTRN